MSADLDVSESGLARVVCGAFDLLDRGDYTPACDKGLFRPESRDYVMQDGEVIAIKHAG